MCTPPCTDTHSLPCAAAGGDCCGMLVGWGPPGRNAKNLFNLIHLTEVIAGLDSGIFVFRMYCYFKNWLNRLNWRKLYCLSTFHCICELPLVSQLDCVQMRYPHTSFFEQQQMPVGNWTGRTCKLFALLKDIHESFRKIHSDCYWWDVLSSYRDRCRTELWPFVRVKPKWKSSCSEALWGLKVEGQWDFLS